MQAAQARQANDMRGVGLPSNSNPRTRAQPACFDASSLPPARHRLPSPALHTCGTDIQVRACIADRGADRDERRFRRHDHTLHRGRRHRYRRSERRIYSRRRRHHYRHRRLGHFSFVQMPDIRISECPGYPDIQVGACIADRGADRGERRQYPPRPQPHSMSRVSTVLCACGMTADASLGMRMCVSGVCVCGH